MESRAVENGAAPPERRSEAPRLVHGCAALFSKGVEHESFLAPHPEQVQGPVRMTVAAITPRKKRIL